MGTTAVAKTIRRRCIMVACKIPLAVLFVLLFFFQAIAGNDDDLRPVTLQLPWHHQFQFAGYYAAKQQGYYHQAGFDVTIRAGEPGLWPLEEVVDGRAQYGVARSAVLLHYLKGEPVVALAAIFQHSAHIFLARKDSGIATPQDLVGRRVMLLPGDDAAEHLATLKSEGVDPEQLNIISSSFDINDLISGKTDAFNAYISNEPYLLEEQNVESVIIRPSTYGIDFYGDTLFSSEHEVTENPDQVKAFREASLKGWLYALSHREEIISLLKEKYQVKKSLNHLRFEANAIEKLVMADLVEIGHMNTGRWQHMADTYVKLGMAEPGYSLEKFIFDHDPPADYSRFLTFFYLILACFVGVAVLLLVLFNRRLNKVLAERTDNLQTTEKALATSEELYQVIFDNTPVGVGLISFDGSIYELNNKALEISGYSREEALQRNVVDLYQDPNDRELLMEKVKKEGFVTGVPCQMKRKDGTPFDGRFTSVIVRVDGEAKMLSMLEDVTLQHEIEAEKAKIELSLQRMQKMEAIGLMAGGVAHDLNNILSGIVSYPELILMQLPEESPLRKSVQEIHNSGKRAAAVVADLLTVARGVASAKECHNLNDLLSECLQSSECQQLKMLYGNVICSANLDPNLDNIACSPVHIKKCLMNLITNAAESIKGEGCIDIFTRNEIVESGAEHRHGLAPGDYVVVSVSDNGPGISEKDKEHIFEPFYTKKVMGRSGTGLGLAVVWNTMQDHHGAIGLESSEKGTVFELYFPACYREVGEDGKTVAPEDIQGHGQLVLIIDDEHQQRDIATQMLESLEYETHAVESGEDAIEYLRDHTADLLLLDMIMDPGINGRETFERIIEIYPEQKAIIVSGFAVTDEVKAAQKKGAGAYIKKPYSIEKIGIAIKKELEK